MFVASTLALLLIGAQGDTHKLQWQLKEGDVFFNKSTVTMDQAIEVMGQNVDQKIEMKTVLRFKVKSIKEGATIIEMTYLESKFDAPGLPGVNPGDQLKNVSFTATFNDKWDIVKVEGYEKFLDAASGGDAEQRKLMKVMTPESAMQQLFNQTIIPTPAKPIAIGDKWTSVEKVSLGPLGKVESKTIRKLEGVKGDVATIQLTGDVNFKPGDGDDADLPFKVTKTDLKADKFAGTQKFDIKTGRLTESEQDVNMSGSMTIEVAGQKAEAKMNIKMKTVSVISNKNPLVD